jgi:hypothetical protein
MAGPKFIPGGSTLFPDTTSLEGPTQPEKGPRGVFAQFPGATKKYTLNAGPRDNEYRETMARMFIEMTEQERKLFVSSVPPDTRPLAEVLAGVGTGGSGGTGFVDFLLTQVNEQYSEKFQVVESLSDNFVVYLFGQSAPQFSYSGLLLNTYQDDQRVWMTRLYQDVLRGTQLARRKKLLRLRYDSVIVSGVMLNLNMAIAADQEDRVPFSFTFIPTQYVIYTPALGNPTKLESAFIPSSAFKISTTQAPPTTRLNVAGRAPASAQATRKRTNGPPDSYLRVAPPSTTSTPKSTPLSDRTCATPEDRKKSQQVSDNIRPGASVQTEPLAPLPISEPL